MPPSPKNIVERYLDEWHVGDHWGSQGSGILVSDETRVLLLHRSPFVMMPGTWGIPGGAVPIDENGHPKDIFRSALDEATEEMGRIPSPGHVTDKKVFQDGSFKYTTFVWTVSPPVLDRFKPRLNWEHDDWTVMPLKEALSMRLHPGVRWFLSR